MAHSGPRIICEDDVDADSKSNVSFLIESGFAPSPSGPKDPRSDKRILDALKNLGL